MSKVTKEELEELNDITWKRVVEESRKKPDDPIAQVFLEVEAELVYLRKELMAVEWG